MTSPVADPNDAVIVRKVIDRIFKRDAPLRAGDARLLKHFEDNAHRVMETTVNTVSNFTGLAVSIPDHVARNIVSRGGTRLLSMDIEGQTRKALFKGLAESRAAGHHPSSAATRRFIQRHVTAGRFTRMVDRSGNPNGHIYRAKLIARTETMYAQNESALQTYEASDAIDQGEIIDNQTGYGDADCMERNGFIGSLDACREHIAQEHPQGTARVLPVLKAAVPQRAAPQHPLSTKPTPSPRQVQAMVDDIVRAAPQEAGQDAMLKEFAARRWGRQEARLASRAEFDQIDSPLIFRGVNHEKHIRSNVKGEWVGKDAVNNGNYHAMPRGTGTGEASFDFVGTDGWAYAAKLDPKAKIISNDQLLLEVLKNPASKRSAFSTNNGREAARLGYDAIYLADDGHYIILNNRALIIDSSSLPGGSMHQRVNALLAENTPEAVAARAQKITDQALDLIKSDPAAGAARIGELFQEAEKLKASVNIHQRADTMRAVFHESYRVPEVQGRDFVRAGVQGI